jgi:hypothetical protein
MSRLAQADIVVERASLTGLGRKAALRVQLRDALAELGRVDSVDRYGIDPPDGPFRDGTFLHDYDWDRFAIVRVIGHVTPFKER